MKKVLWGLSSEILPYIAVHIRYALFTYRCFICYFSPFGLHFLSLHAALAFSSSNYEYLKFLAMKTFLDFLSHGQE